MTETPECPATMPESFAECWPPRDTVAKLVEAVTHLLDAHDCDTDGYEQFKSARDVAATWLASSLGEPVSQEAPADEEIDFSGPTPRPVVFTGCNEECVAEGGFPALCEMYPDNRHVGCSRQTRVRCCGALTVHAYDCKRDTSSASPLSEEERALVEEWRQALSFWPHADPAIPAADLRGMLSIIDRLSHSSGEPDHAHLEYDAACSALSESGIAGIFDDFASLSDAIRQMAQHIRGLEFDRDERQDTKRLDWLTENAFQLSTVSQGETNDGVWDVFPNDLDEASEGADAPQGRTPREAIDAALSRLSASAPSPEEAK